MTHAPKSFWITLSALGGWLLLTAAVFILGTGQALVMIRGFWPVLSLFLFGIYCVAGLIAAAIAYYKKRAVRWIGVALITGLPALLLSFWLPSFCVRAHFKLNQQHYEAKVQQILNAPNEAARRQICGEDCWVGGESPRIINFHYAWLIVSGDDIVYDPAGIERKTIEQKVDHPRDLHRVVPLDGDWYLCSYSD